MPNNFNYRYGDTSPVKLPYKSGFAVSIGDLSYVDTADVSTIDANQFPVKSAGSLAWPTAVATPVAPTVAASSPTGGLGTALTAAATGVKVSYQFPWGEGPLSPAGSVTPAAGGGILLSGVALPAPAFALNVYVETAAGSGTYKLYSQYDAQYLQNGQGAVLIVGYGVGQPPPASPLAASATVIAQYNFTQLFAGVAAQSFDGTVTTAYGINDGYLRTDTAGVFDFACAAANFNAGDLVGPAANGTPNALLPQTVIAVPDRSLAVGRVVAGGSGLTTVRVEVFSKRFNRGRVLA